MIHFNEISAGILLLVGVMTALAYGLRKLFSGMRSALKEFKKLADELKLTTPNRREKTLEEPKKRRSVYALFVDLLGPFALITLNLCWLITETGPVTRSDVFLIAGFLVLAGVNVVLLILQSWAARISDITGGILGVIRQLALRADNFGEWLQLKIESDRAEKKQDSASTGEAGQAGSPPALT